MINGFDEKIYSVKLSYKDLELIQLALAEIQNSATRTIVDTFYEPKNIDPRRMCENIITRLSEMTSTADTLCKMSKIEGLNSSDFSFILTILEKDTQNIRK